MPKECSSSGDGFNSGGRSTGRFSSRSPGKHVAMGDAHMGQIFNPDPSAPENGTIKREQFWTVDSAPGRNSRICENPAIGASFKGPRVTSESHATVKSNFIG